VNTESTSKQPAVRLKRLTKRFRHVTAVDRLSLDVMPGEVLALIGANGSGKSTTFRLMLNIYKACAGEAELLGRSSANLNGQDFEDICYVSEGQKLPQWMSVEYFLNYCSELYPKWDQALCERLLEAFDLPLQQKIKHLSRGQKMKTAVASTLPCRPKLLLLDEPFSGLDVETRAQLSSLLRKLAKDDGLATIITTHDVEEVEPVATRIAILSNGQLQINEALDTFLQRHRHLSLEGLNGNPVPEAFTERVIQIEGVDGRIEYHTDRYSDELHRDLQAGLPAGCELTAQAMPLRKILTGKAVQF
jgi:ABC-2 type transport system ATP-binding protein